MKTIYARCNTVALLIIFASAGAWAQVQTFEKTLGGSRADYGHSLSSTADGGFILAGQTYSYGDTTSDTWLIKTDAFGNQQWTRTMGSDTLDGANSVAQTQDGGYFVVNHTEGYGTGDCEAWMFRTDGEGNILWSQTYGCPGDDVGEDGIETSTGDFIATGVTRIADNQGDAFIAKYAPDGSTKWIKNYGGPEGQLGMRIVEAPGGGYVVTGAIIVQAGLPEDIMVFKTNENGDLLWLKNYGGAGIEEAYGLIATSDGGYLISGFSTSFGNGDRDAYLLKIDENGTQQWSRNYGGLEDEGAYSIAATAGGFVATGATNSFGDPTYMLILKTDLLGNLLWMKTIGDQEYIKGGSWIVSCNDGGLAIVGTKQKTGTDNSDLYFVKTDSEGNLSLNVDNLSDNSPHFVISPDPAEKNITLSYDNLISEPEVRIYNALGRLVFEGVNLKKINVASLCGGIYFITLKHDDKFYSQRFVKM